MVHEQLETGIGTGEFSDTNEYISDEQRDQWLG
jgi:hypothetical protein